MKKYLMIALIGAFEGAIYELHDAIEEKYEKEAERPPPLQFYAPLRNEYWLTRGRI